MYTNKQKKIKVKSVKGWAGIVCDKIDKTEELYDARKIYAIYPTKSHAGKYELLIKVLITPIPQKGKRK